MKAVQIVARGKTEFIEMPDPILQAGHAIIKTQRISLCGSDVRYIHHLPDHRYPCPPGTTGHEMVGIIADIGDNEAGLQVGDRVLALAPNHQAMAEFYLAKVENLLKLDDSVTFEQAVQAQQFGTVLYAAKELPDLSGKTVAIIGQGSAGLWFNTVAKDRDAHKIIALDLKEYRLQLSDSYGATHTIHNADVDPIPALKDINGGELPDVVIEAAGEKESIALAVDIVRENGFILFFGVPRFETMEFPMLDFFFKTITARTMVHATREENHASTRKALEMITSGAVDVTPMLTHTFSFDQVMDAYDLHRLQDEGAIKIIVDMNA